MRHGSFLVATVLPLGPVILGFVWGVSEFYARQPASITGNFAEVAVLFMLAGVGLSLVMKTVDGAKYRNWVGTVSLCYSVGVVFFEPFLLHRPEIDEIIVAVLVLAPLLVAIGYFVRAGAWVSVIGVTLFVFISSAMLAKNSYRIYECSGFFRSLKVRT